MDKLEPLIRHRFWVLFAIALPLALVGYFLASGEMKAATEEKEQSLKSTLDGVPGGKTEPNETYAAGLGEINEGLQAENKVEVQKLWEAQRTRMHWPTIMVKKNYLPDEYRGEVVPAARMYYTQVYPEIIKRVWERAQPVVDDPPPLGLDVTWPKKLLLMPETIPVHEFERNVTPTNKQIWDAQEDVWLLELIFDGIVRANQDATWIVDAPVRRIEELSLTGGSGESSVISSGTAAAGGGFASGSSQFEEDDDGPSGFGGKSGRSRSRQSSSGGGGDVSFDVTEEFGLPLPDPEEVEAAETQSPVSGSLRFEEEDDGGGARGGGRVAAGMQFRYIGKPPEVEAAPYRERGFYMSAIVMLPELPSFFAAMSSSEWPIRILRFQVGPNPYQQSRVGGRRGGLGGRRRANNYDEDDEDSGGGFRFGRGGFGRGGGGLSRGGFGGGGFGRRGFAGAGDEYNSRGGSIGLPISMQGPRDIDPNWFADPDLVQVDFCGIITMYNPQTDDTLAPTPDGSSAEETPEVIAEREADLQAAAEEAAAEEAATQADAAANDGTTTDGNTTDGNTTDGDGPAAEPAPPTETEPSAQNDGTAGDVSPAESPPE